MFKKNILFLYRPEKDIKLPYKITYSNIGEKEGKVILNSKLDIQASYNIFDINEKGHAHIRFTLDNISFISNNVSKEVPYKGESNMLTMNQQGQVIERKGEIPYGILEHFNFSFPAKSIALDSFWESTCYSVFSNIKNPVEITGIFRFDRFEGFKGYNCTHLSFVFQPKSINLTTNIRQSLSGQGDIFFDPTYSIIACMTLNTISDTGSPGLLFRSFFKQEINPSSIRAEHCDNTSHDVIITEEYFTRY
ncbi:MAG TPA: hypothetical protein PL110_03335 [Candidatus Eremiobacteraeota bacterium]|nr:MAG: hypothetical protein BWY64_00939 [bacterium ADurb.Bin363]HPZ07121.1 hypothetical protein [Candidatus Eremiobacteraeota bacterium]